MTARWPALLIFACLAVYMLAAALRSRGSVRARRRLERHLGGPGKHPRDGARRAAAALLGRLELSPAVRGVRSVVEPALPGVSWPVFRAAWLSGVALAPCLVSALSGNWLSLPATAALAASASLALPRLLSGRLARLEREGLDRFAGEVALLLQCGVSLEDAFITCAAGAADCVRSRLERVSREIEMSADTLGALSRFSSGCSSEDLRLVAAAALAARETGADMRPVMSNIGEAVRERERIRRELLTQTVQGRASGHVVTALPLVFLTLSALVSKGALGVLFGTLPGIIILVTSAVLDVAGTLWIRKILDIEV